MKIFSANKLYAPIVFGAIWLLSGCERELISNPEQYTKIYMPQAIDSPKVHDLFMRDTLQSIVFGAAYGGVMEQSNAITVKFKVDPSLIAGFNTRNHTNYLLLPTNSYELTGTEALIQKGAINSNALKVKIKTVGGIQPLTDYLLPVSIESVSPSMALNPNLRTTYFKIRGTYEDYSRTGWSVTGVSSQETGSGGANVLDGNTGTNWHTQWRTAKPNHPHWIVIDMNKTNSLHGLYFWPANTSNGNPARIHVDISMNGTTWQDAGDYTLVNTFERQVVYFSSTKEARYFRVIINSSTGATHFTHPAEIGAF